MNDGGAWIMRALTAVWIGGMFTQMIVERDGAAPFQICFLIALAACLSVHLSERIIRGVSEAWK